MSYAFICFTLKNPSLKELIKTGNREEAIKEIKKIYRINKHDLETIEKVYLSIECGLGEINSSVGIIEATTSYKYRRAFINGLLV